MPMQTLAARGVAREDLLPGLRITHVRKRAIIAYLLDDETVSVVGVFYGGQDCETALGSEGGYVKADILWAYTCSLAGAGLPDAEFVQQPAAQLPWV
ncbi:hypothetical protein [Paraburkholderia sp. BCC1876]|uniref:hypothetical protein n=1 Tax=Paraburkholderia sp. BCC1876 TaxID=2676303 RepID=UPI001ABAA30D|nr:hypothetical protein [Paraburkholderia sp. BCC1876]